MIQDNVTVIGDINIKLLDDDGNVTYDSGNKNMVVATGKSLIASLIAGLATAPTHIGLGTSNTASAITQTALLAEVGTRRVFNSVYTTENIVTFVTTFPSGVGTAGTFREAGIFNALTGGVMMCRSAFNAFTKTTADNLVITWNVRIN